MCKLLLFYFLSFLIFNISLCDNNVEGDLLSVVVIYRHGDRAIVRPYPNDPYKNISYWPVGFGQLTNKGKEQHLELGKWYRNRYQNFLPQEYSEKDVHVRSSDVDRTIMSAESNLAGLYPPIAGQIWNPDIKWQPIPVHTLPEQLDAVLAMKKNCPKYNKLQKQLFSSPFFKNLTHQYHDLYAYLTRYSGEIISTLETAEYLYSTLFIEKLFNFTLPDWTKPVFPTKLEPLAFLSFATSTYTQDMARLKVGPLFNEIITYFQNVSLSTSNNYKLLMFSGHDITIANILNSIGAFSYHCPPYASTVIFELRKGNNGSYVNIFYKNSTEPQQITLKGCDFNCKLDDFVNLLKPITVNLEQWENECSLSWIHYWPLSFAANLVIMGLLSTLIVICLLLTVRLICIKRQKERSYIQLPNEEYT